MQYLNTLLLVVKTVFLIFSLWLPLARPSQGLGPLLPVCLGHLGGHVLGAGGEAVHLHAVFDKEEDEILLDTW